MFVFFLHRPWTSPHHVRNIWGPSPGTHPCHRRYHVPMCCSTRDEYSCPRLSHHVQMWCPARSKRALLPLCCLTMSISAVQPGTTANPTTSPGDKLCPYLWCARAGIFSLVLFVFFLHRPWNPVPVRSIFGVHPQTPTQPLAPPCPSEVSNQGRAFLLLVVPPCPSEVSNQGRALLLLVVPPCPDVMSNYSYQWGTLPPALSHHVRICRSIRNDSESHHTSGTNCVHIWGVRALTFLIYIVCLLSAHALEPSSFIMFIFGACAHCLFSLVLFVFFLHTPWGPVPVMSIFVVCAHWLFF